MEYIDQFTLGMHVDSGLDIDHCRDHLTGVLQALYTTGDTEQLEYCLEEVAHALGISLPEGDIAIEKKNQNRELHYQLGYQRALLDTQRKVS